MTGSAVRCFSMNGDGRSIGGSGSDYSKEGGGLGEGGLQIAPGWRLADDGKRSSGDGRCIGIASRREDKKGREFEGGRVKNRTGWEAVG